MHEPGEHGVKLVHMMRRASGLRPDEFQRAWLGVDLPGIVATGGLLRYGQNHALLRGYAKGELLFDGFEEYWFANQAHLMAALSSPDWQARQRASTAFLDPSQSIWATVDICVQKDGIPPSDAIRSTEFVNRRPDLTITEFRRYWRSHHGPLATGIPQIIRYEQNHLDDREYRSGPPRFDGWAATWFTSTAAMREAKREPVLAQTRADEPNFLTPPLPVLFTRERLAILGA